VILGDRGYWGTAAHRLAQPHHIFALPHMPSDEFVDPAEHDELQGILPHESRSAYIHSHDYQARIIELEKATFDRLHKLNKKVFIARTARVKQIEKHDTSRFSIEIDIDSTYAPISAHLNFLSANKVIVATGAGPSRQLSQELQSSLSASDLQESDAKNIASTEISHERILDYTDVLSKAVEKCRGKDVVIYGGGATAAWAMEVAALYSKPLAWVAKSGFGQAIKAGPRVAAIINSTRRFQIHGIIDTLTYTNRDSSGDRKISVKVVSEDPQSLAPPQYFLADYVFNCIGQEPYEKGGLPEMISPEIKTELTPYLDKNYVTGTDQASMLGWSTPRNDLMIIGAAQGTYYNKDKPITRPPFVSDYLPRSGQVAITIGGVVSSVCALTNYMPFSQNPYTGKVTTLSLNVHIMNASQLAVHFTASFPDAHARDVNHAVKSLIVQRSKTEFGLPIPHLAQFMQTHFGNNAQMLQQRLRLFSALASGSNNASHTSNVNVRQLHASNLTHPHTYALTHSGFFASLANRTDRRDNEDTFAFISTAAHIEEINEDQDNAQQQATASTLVQVTNS
jgi:hypothetical protein